MLVVPADKVRVAHAEEVLAQDLLMALIVAFAGTAGRLLDVDASNRGRLLVLIVEVNLHVLTIVHN